MAGIYIHIPFCKKRCIYCDFFSTTQSEAMDLYIETLCKELEIRQNYLKNEKIETIYLGGGTPSQINVEDLKKIFRALSLYTFHPPLLCLLPLWRKFLLF